MAGRIAGGDGWTLPYLDAFPGSATVPPARRPAGLGGRRLANAERQVLSNGPPGRDVN